MYIIGILFLLHLFNAEGAQCLCQCSLPGYHVSQVTVEQCDECEGICEKEYPDMNCGTAASFSHMCEKDPVPWSGRYSFDDGPCDTQSCCCPTYARAGPVSNNTVTITLECATRTITETHHLELHQLYIILGNSSGVLVVSNDGLYYADTNGVCTAFGDRKNTGALIVGIVIGLILVLLLGGIGTFVWYRNKQNQPESAPLRV